MCQQPISLLIAIGSVAIVPLVALAQTTTPLTEWGTPDLRGIWNHGTATPLERPDRYAGRNRLSADEVAEVNAEQRTSEGAAARRAVWWERGLSDGRTSMIVDPADGKIPYTEDARARLRAQPPLMSDGPEDRNLRERCITYGVPRLGGVYSQNIHIGQTQDHVLLLHEMIHEFRVIPLDGRAHLPTAISQWLGDARGHWEGNTLVVETTNFDVRQRFQGFSQKTVRLIERFTRVGTNTLRYAVTFRDLELWTQPWTATLTMPRTDGPMFEFACHEGNVGMTNLLEFARMADAAEAH